MKNWLPILLTLALLSIVAVAAASHFMFTNNGNIVVTVNVEAYEDFDLSTPLVSIDWLDLQPQEVRTTMIWLNSTSNVPVNLTLKNTGWSPENASDYVALTWDREGTLISPAETLNATLTLTVDNVNASVTSFDFTFTTSIGPKEEQ